MYQKLQHHLEFSLPRWLSVDTYFTSLDSSKLSCEWRRKFANDDSLQRVFMSATIYILTTAYMGLCFNRMGRRYL